MAKCSAIKADNGRCKVEAMPGAEWCWNHHPGYAEARRRRASRGGKRGGRGRPLVAASDVADQMQDLSDKVLAGELDRADAAVCGQLLNVKLRALEVGRKLREAEDLEWRMEELEALVAARKERPWGA
jgi:hypothetical protein